MGKARTGTVRSGARPGSACSCGGSIETEVAEETPVSQKAQEAVAEEGPGCSTASGITAGTCLHVWHLQGFGAFGSGSGLDCSWQQWGHLEAVFGRAGAPPAQPQRQNACGRPDTAKATAIARFRQLCIQGASAALFLSTPAYIIRTSPGQCKFPMEAQGGMIPGLNRDSTPHEQGFLALCGTSLRRNSH
jgi:hypothetical protein